MVTTQRLKGLLFRDLNNFNVSSSPPSCESFSHPINRKGALLSPRPGIRYCMAVIRVAIRYELVVSSDT